MKMFKTCPEPTDVQELQFKLHCRLKIFNNKEIDTFSKAYNLISCASRYGLLFLGSNTSNLQVVQLKSLENYSPKDKDISNYPRRNVPLPSPPLHISVNCDSTILAIVTERDNCPNVTFYDVLSFYKQNISVVTEIRLSPTPGTYVREVGWNPALPPIFTACKSDGTLGVYELKGTSININELPAASEATCFCWSPKGKQIAVGSKNSRITQYKPDLKAVKVINQPPLEGIHSLISLQWVSNYQFIGIYQSAEPEGTAKLIVVDAPKTGDPVYTNYEDVCYSGTTRLPQFYMILQQHWNILMVASSNSTELGVLGSSGETWTQWIISDSARAELPLSADHQETLPVGLALDTSSTRPLPWNESSIPPCPYLLILSHQGVLCLFSVVNLKEGIPSICAPPDAISDLSGINHFVTSDNTATSAPIEPPKPAVQQVSAAQNLPATPAPIFGAKVLSQPQPAFTAPPIAFGTKPTENKPLFGGQVTITPIKPQQPAAQPLFGGQTFITPISKQQPSTTATVNTAEKYSTIFSALNTPASVPPPVESKPIIIASKPAPPSEQPSNVQIAATTPVKAAEPPKSAVTVKMKEETDNLLSQMLRDECVSLESELKALLHQGRAVNINIGSEEEKIDLVMKIESLQEFIKEIVDISIGENAEVHYLKQNLIQSWAWYEEARSRYNASKDETVSLLLRSQPLDSATEKKQADIRKMMYYIESQISQASKALDEQWDNFQDYAKKVHRTRMPTMEAIFQAMVRQNVILQKQRYILKDIANRLKGKSHTTIPSLLLSLQHSENLEDSLNRLKIDQHPDIHQMQYERVLNRMKNLSEAKTKKLRNLLKNREVLHVTAIKPQLSSSLMLQSPESKTKRLLSNLSALAPPATPTAAITAPVPKALSFVHSTPLPERKPDIKPLEVPSSSTQIDAKAFTFKKVEKNTLPTTNSFIPLSKSASIFSNLPQEGTLHTPSAFAATQNFVGGPKFSFASPAVTAAAAAVKAATGAAAPTTFAFGTTSAALPKFGAAAAPKTPEMSAATDSAKPSLPQFNFGGALSVTAVATAKPTKPSFSFGGTSNMFGASATTAGTSPQTTVTTVSSSLFGNLTQANKPQTATMTSSSTPSIFGAANTSKLSAFSAVTPNASNLSLSAATTPKPEDSVMKISGPTFTFDSLLKATTSSNLPVTTSTKPTLTVSSTTFPKQSLIENTSANATVASTGSVFSSPTATTTPVPIFQSASTPTTTTEVTSSPILTFGALATTKQTFAFASPSTTTSVSPVSSLVFSVTTSTSTKPTSSVSSSSTTSVQSLFFGGAQSITSSASSSAPTTSVFSTSTIPTAATKPISFVVATPAQTSVSATPSLFSTAGSSGTQPASGGTATTQSSFFGATQSTASVTTVQSSSIFGLVKPTAATQPSIFGTAITSTQPSIFGGTQSSTTSGVSTASPSTIFGASKTGTSQSSIFGATVTSTQPPIFGGTQSTASSVSTTTHMTPTFSSSGSGVATTQTSVFEMTTPSTKPSIFGSGTSSQKTTTPSIFGTPTTTTQPAIFGGVPTTSSTTTGFGAASNQSSIFGTNTATSSQQGSIFGGGTNTSQASVFGASPATASVAQTSIFGGAKPASTTKSSIFGGVQTTQSPIFAASTAPSTQPSIFGTPSTSASPFAPAFGTTSTLSSPFGQTSPAFGTPKTTASTFGTGFGSPTGFGATPSTTTSIFGQPASFGSTSAPAFGAPTTSTNMFGSSTSTFGANTSANVFGASTSSASSFSFAGPASSASNTAAFGFGGLNVGSPTTASSVFGGGGSTFGQTTAANPFSRPTEQKSPFGGGTSNIFSNTASSSGSIFGSNTGSTFSSNTQSGFGGSTFGSPSTFGQQSPFGQSSFGNTSFGNAPPGPFSSGSGAVAQTGFGSPQNFAKPSGFGSPPVFGGSPQLAFGAAPSFGGSPAFGATPAFGSPGKVFGANTSSAGFGSASTASAGFGNLATQNTVGFGSLAQQAASPNSAPFSGSSSFSSWR